MTGRVVVAGVGRSGVSTLTEAIGIVDSAVDVCRWNPLDAAAPVPEATVGLVVIDPSSIVGDEERRVLDRLRTEIGVAAVVCTKVDAFWDWPTIAKASRAVLDPEARLPVFAVSGAAAVAGAVDESGVDDLVRWIRDHTDDDPVRVASRSEAARAAGLDEIVARGRRPGPPMTAESLRATRARLVRSRDRGRTDRVGALRGGLNRARAAAIADLDAGIRDLSVRSRDALADLRRDDVDGYVSSLADDVGGLRDRLEVSVRDDVDRVRAVALLGVEPVPAETDAGPRREPMTLRPPVERRRIAEDAGLILVGASVGAGIGRLVVTPLAGVHTLQWISMPLTLVVGAAVMVWLVRVRRLGALRAQMRTWTAEVLGESRAAIEHDVIGLVGAAEPVIAGQVMRHYERRARMVADDLTRVDADIRAISPGRGTETPSTASKVTGDG